MTQQNSNQAMSNQPPAIQMLMSSGVKSQIEAAVPKSVAKELTPDRMARIAMTEFRKSPNLAKCEPASIVGTIIQAAQVGLEPGSALGHCYMVPYGRQCQLIIGYRGMIDLARRSNQIEQINAWVVRDSDTFEYNFGLNPDIKHKPNDKAIPCPKGEDITHVYAVARLVGGGVQFEVMTRAEVEAIRAQSKAGKSGPWVQHWGEMAKKTVVRRLFKMLPVSLEIQRAVGFDEQADAGEQKAGAYVEGEYSVVDDYENAIEGTSDAYELLAKGINNATETKHLEALDTLDDWADLKDGEAERLRNMISEQQASF